MLNNSYIPRFKRHDAMKEVPEVTETEVKLVWYPAWSVDKMSRYARIALGIR